MVKHHITFYSNTGKSNKWIQITFETNVAMDRDYTNPQRALCCKFGNFEQTLP